MPKCEAIMKRFYPLLLILIITSQAWSQSAYNISLKGSLSIGNNRYANIWGYTQNGKEYALLGCAGSQTLNDACAIIDVTNPTTPNLLFKVPGPQSTWREIRTYQNYAYITTEAAGLDFGVTIVDLQYLPDSIRTKQWSANGLFGNVHALHIENGYMYLYGSNNPLSLGGALIVSLADPWNPTVAGAYNSRYVHDGTVLGNIMYPGEIFSGTFSIVDVTNKQQPVEINSQLTPNAFTHNTWLSSNNQVLYTTDEVGDAFVTAYDISDPTNIKELDRYKRVNSFGAIPHNTYVLNSPAITGNNSDYVWTSYYTEGVTLVDGTKPDNLIEVGHYDCTNLSGDDFAGAWGVYPYLPSGNILVSDMEQGLFVLDPNYTRACYLEGTVKDKLTGQVIATANVQNLTDGLLKTSKLDGTYKTGFALQGTHRFRFSKSGYKNKEVDVLLLPGQTINLDVELELSSTSTVNEEFKEVNIYPNNFTEFIMIDNESSNKFNATVMDMNGRLLKSFKVELGKNKIDLNNLQSGVYTISLINKENSKQYKIIKL